MISLVMALAATFNPAASTAPAATTREQATAASVAERLASELAELTITEQTIVRPTMAGYTTDNFKVIPQFAEMEAKNPGIVAKIVEAMRPVVARHLASRILNLRQRHAKIYASRLSQNELALIVNFQASPVGRKLLQLALAEADPGDSIRPALQAGTAMTPAMKSAEEARANERVEAGLSATEQTLLQRFLESSPGIKFTEVQDELAAETSAWVQETNSLAAPDVQRAAQQAIADFTSGK